MKKIMTVYGTRPEAIKVAPIIKALEAADNFESIPVVTGQHREMLDQVNNLFEITPVEDLNIMSTNQTLNGIVSKVIAGVDEIYAKYEPDAVIVQGDTSTVMGAAVAAFNRQIPVVHLAPTAESKGNLLREDITEADIAVTGNSVIDALLEVVKKPVELSEKKLAEFLDTDEPVVLVTTHRRENLGENMQNIGRAVQALAREYPNYRFVFPAHKNPKVREAVLPFFEGLENVLAVEPLAYAEFTHVIDRARFVLTDSGGVQEEAPSLGKPVLVLRENTERPEAVDAGTVRLIGAQYENIVAEAKKLIDDQAHFDSMANAVNPYGDGKAAERTVAALEELFGLGQRKADFAV
ncbi:non-hydrolyzing UDP-N-acetylglucosamine 2-epimerase [Rothia terrae]|uniref:non-hydrolyzing UDP-N-acetylglucosamine 2-epimerase n=1 Tax=Rothia terrae TaxID=396015 RepID=UPI0033F362BA